MPLQPATTDPRPVEAPLAEVERRMIALLGEPETGLTPVTAAARQHLRAGGGRLRARLALSAASALGLAPDTAVAIAATAELLHNASLVHDDLQDGDRERRGAPTVWAAHGTDVAICTGDMLLSAAFAAAAPLAARRNGRSLAAVHGAVAETIRGQVADRRAANAPLRDREDYRRLARAKSGPLIALPVELALCAAGRPEALDTAGEAGRNFALAYQVADDLADVGADRRRGCVNIVSLIVRCEDLGEAQARAEAASAARQALDDANAAADALPLNSGRGLIEAGTALVARIEAGEGRAHAP